MTCKTCSIHDGPFITEKDFKSFLNNLNLLVENGSMKKIESRNQISPFFEDAYICSRCQQIWLLDFPDQAFRGGWHAA